MTQTTIKALVLDRLSAVDTLINQQLSSSIPLISDLSSHLINSGGKRLRPLLVLLTAQAYGYTGNADITLGAVIELVHAATLLHDDVVDNSMIRRGKETANALWDNAACVLVGDFLYSRAFQLMVGAENLIILKMLADATNLISEGEVLQLLNRHNPDTTESAYLDVLRYKTGTLFAASTQIGAMLAKRPVADIEAMQRFGETLGIAFQLIDDALDYCADAATLGKSLGDDLAEGKPTLPLIYALQHATPTHKQIIQTALLEGDRSALPVLLEIIEACGALTYTQRIAEDFAEQARTILQDSMPESIYRDAIRELITLAVQRVT